MNIQSTNDTIKVGDAVCVVLPQECETLHAPGILGVVRKIYYDQSGKEISVYGVEASGEIIFYLADQIAKVSGVIIDEPDSKDIKNIMWQNILFDSILSSYDTGIISWPEKLRS